MSTSHLSSDALLAMQDVSLSYVKPNSDVFVEASLKVRYGEKITIVGGNGVGKTSLMRLITGDLEPTDGEVLRRQDLRIGYLPQDLSYFIQTHGERTLLEVATLGTNFEDVGRKLSSVALDKSSSAAILQDVEREFNAIGGYEFFQHLHGFGLADVDFYRQFKLLSGGEKTKTAMIRLLLGSYDLLLLDEPTNHIDVSAIGWLEYYLKSCDEAVLLITHDRSLLNAVTRNIYEIDNATHSLVGFKGTYQAFLSRKKAQEAQLLQGYQAQQTQLRKLKSEATVIHEHSKHNRTTARDNNKLAFNARGERRQKGVSNLIKQKKRALKQIENNLIVRPEKRFELDWSFHRPNQTGSVMLENLTIHQNNKCLFSDANFEINVGQRILLSGDNGSGKTTLLETIMGYHQPLQGSVVCTPGVKIGYLTQENRHIDHALTVQDFFLETALKQRISLDDDQLVRTMMHHCALNPSYLGTRLDLLSMGQLARVKMAAMILCQPNIILLDEPTNHLDILSAEYLEKQLLSFRGGILAVSHDRWFINQFNAHETFNISKGQLIKHNAQARATKKNGQKKVHQEQGYSLR